MKRIITISILVISIISIVLAETNSFYYDYVKDDWFATQSAAEANIPAGLSDREKEIYRAAYANGFYDALHPAYIEGKYSLQGTTQGRYLTGGVPPVRFSM